MIPSLVRLIGSRGWADPARVAPSVVVPIPGLRYGSRCTAEEPGFGYGCARKSGHGGRHACFYLSNVTGDRGRVLAVWS